MTEQEPCASTSAAESIPRTRSKSESLAPLQKICFVCNTVRNSDGQAYNQGGLRRCDSDNTAKKILSRKTVLLDLKEHRLYPAAKRLDVILSGYHDIFAADVHIHQSCYLKFSTNSIQPKTNDKEQEKMQK